MMQERLRGFGASFACLAKAMLTCRVRLCCVPQLLRHGADVTLADMEQRRPLHIAAFSGLASVTSALLQYNVRTTSLSFFNAPHQPTHAAI